jgi:50S ribosomal protein L16 3-hydroxylase
MTLASRAALERPLALLGGLAPAAFMRRHWHKRPLLVRAAWPGVMPPLERDALFALAARDDVESRLVQRAGDGWTLRHGPLASRRALPSPRRAGWTLLVQGLDLHVDAAHALLAPFRFIPAARLDDVMVSYASDGGGVGPHLDSYDVFLLQVQGQRRWGWGRVAQPRWRADTPLKMLRGFVAQHEAVLEPGDILYLPPGWGHDGVAVGADCMTCSIGFRAPAQGELVRELLVRIGDAADGAPDAARLYRDPAQSAVADAARVPDALRAHAAQALARALRTPGAVDDALGCWLSEPKPQVWFEGGASARPSAGRGVTLDRRTRMLYDRRRIYINGESLRAGGADARALHALADARRLDAPAVKGASPALRRLLGDWAAAGWLHADTRESEDDER